MAGITQKNCVALFLLWSLKKSVFGRGARGRADVNQEKHMKKIS